MRTYESIYDVIDKLECEGFYADYFDVESIAYEIAKRRGDGLWIIKVPISAACPEFNAIVEKYETLEN